METSVEGLEKKYFNLRLRKDLVRGWILIWMLREAIFQLKATIRSKRMETLFGSLKKKYFS